MIRVYLSEHVKGVFGLVITVCRLKTARGQPQTDFSVLRQDPRSQDLLSEHVKGVFGFAITISSFKPARR